jgi:hypothetical protein
VLKHLVNLEFPLHELGAVLFGCTGLDLALVLLQEVGLQAKLLQQQDSSVCR